MEDSSVKEEETIRIKGRTQISANRIRIGYPIALNSLTSPELFFLLDSLIVLTLPFCFSEQCVVRVNALYHGIYHNNNDKTQHGLIEA